MHFIIYLGLYTSALSMSIEWQNFNEDITWTPTSVVNEVRRITQVPPGSTVADFLNIYATEINKIDLQAYKLMLKFCIFCWMYKMTDKFEDPATAKADIAPKVKESWNNFCDEIDRTAELIDNGEISPRSIAAEIDV
tara:strand:- start:831 stop:1241 length:411 start_codon:yes stop_codon:yes gene_type:complete